jgi:hypothetical protein
MLVAFVAEYVFLVSCCQIFLGNQEYVFRKKVKHSHHRPGVAQRVPGS